jgi:hypothetical protein
VLATELGARSRMKWPGRIDIECFINQVREEGRGLATLRSICLHVITSSHKLLTRALADDSPLPDDARRLVYQTRSVRFPFYMIYCFAIVNLLCLIVFGNSLLLASILFKIICYLFDLCRLLLAIV